MMNDKYEEIIKHLSKAKEIYNVDSEDSLPINYHITCAINDLERLNQIENVKGSEVMEALDKIYNEPFNILKLDNAPLSAVPQFANFAKHVYNYILKAQAQERELRELEKSDGNKEQSSIDYYNEMKKHKRELNELKSKVGNFIDKHMAYPYGENGELFDDEYTKDYVELKELVGEDDE